MTEKKLYRIHRSDGGVTVSINPPIDNKEKTETLFRLIADDGKLLTKDGINTTPCIDVDVTDGWYEIDDPEFEISEVNNLE